MNLQILVCQRVKDQPKGDQRAGVVWHTQGSGKSLSMVFYTGKLVLAEEMNNPTILVLTDRNDLDQQLFETFGNCEQLIQTETKTSRKQRRFKRKTFSGFGWCSIYNYSKVFARNAQEQNILN
jgi:type I restriction enzyme R subunit